LRTHGPKLMRGKKKKTKLNEGLSEGSGNAGGHGFTSEKNILGKWGRGGGMGYSDNKGKNKNAKRD